MLPLIAHQAPNFLLAVISCWLGLSLLVRATRDPATRAFAWFCLFLALYGITSLLPQFTAAAVTVTLLDRLQLVATVLTPPAFLHFIMVLTAPGRNTPVSRAFLVTFYITGVAFALYAIFGPLPDHGPGWSWTVRGEPIFAFPESLAPWLTLAWVAQRIMPLLVALIFMWMAYRYAPSDAQERQLRRVFAVTALVGVVGAMLGTAGRALAQSPNRTLAIELLASPALSRSFILVAMIVLAYAVLSYRALLPERVARRTFLYSIMGSLVTTLYIGLILLAEWLVETWLRITIPIVTIFALIILVALLGPLSEWFRNQFDRRFYKREFDYGRLIQTLSNDVFQQGELSERIQATLSAVCRTLGVRDGLVAVTTPEGLAVQAAYGQAQAVSRLPDTALPEELQTVQGRWEPWPSARFLVPLRHGDENLGLMVLGPRRADQIFNFVERGVLDYLSSYLALAIRHERVRSEQQTVIKDLARQSESLRTQQAELAEVLEAARQPEEPPSPAEGLRVHALGSLRVERNGEVITRWGGDKAGTNQAAALFAFLFDRRGRGITKEEAVDVIWPDADLDDIKRADNAFHRTLTGLRRTLEPDLKHASKSQTIQFHNSRYWLEPASIAWCDTEVFTALVEQGITQFHQHKYVEALEALKQAIQLYRGDYMDDSPLFGDSPYVEEQRQIMLSCYIQAQLRLSVLYELQGRMGESATAYQEAEYAQRRVLAIAFDHPPQDVHEQHQVLLRQTRDENNKERQRG